MQLGITHSADYHRDYSDRLLGRSYYGQQFVYSRKAIASFHQEAYADQRIEQDFRSLEIRAAPDGEHRCRNLFLAKLTEHVQLHRGEEDPRGHEPWDVASNWLRESGRIRQSTHCRGSTAIRCYLSFKK
jgi:hypothetical protein